MDMNRVSGVSADGSWQSLTSCARILLVDKNPASLVYTASLLQEQLYNVTTATSAVTALRLFEACKGFYDIVMADTRMQDMHIFEFMQRIRDYCLTRTPIILMAEDYRVDFMKEALKNGASFFYPKPVKPCNIAVLWQHLWRQILRFPGRQPDEGNGKKRVLINSDHGNGKRSKIPNTQDHVIIKEGGSRKTSSVGNKHGSYQSPIHFEKLYDARRLNPSSVCYTRDGVQQIVNRFNSNNAFNGGSENVIKMNTGSHQVYGENGIPIFMKEGQLTLKDGHLTHAFQIPNQETSNDLNNAPNGTPENVIMNTGSDQVAAENEVQILMEEDQVTPIDGYLTDPFQIPTDTIEEELTLDDISQLLSYVNGEDWDLRAEENSPKEHLA